MNMNTAKTIITPTTVGESEDVQDTYKTDATVKRIQYGTTWFNVKIDEVHGFWEFLPSHRPEVPKELQGKFTSLRYAAAALESYALAHKERPKQRRTPNYKKLHEEGKIKKAKLVHGETESNSGRKQLRKGADNGSDGS